MSCFAFSAPRRGTGPRHAGGTTESQKWDAHCVPFAGTSDGAPKAVTVESPYGWYTRIVELGEGSVTLRRRMQLRQQLVPASDYEKIRAFLTDAAKADKASLVLKRLP